MTPLLVLGIALAAAGTATVVLGWRRHAATAELIDIIGEPDGGGTGDRYVDRLHEPLPVRLLKPLGRWLAGKASSLLPSNYLEQLRRKLVRAGLASRFSAEEFLAIQAVSLAGGLVLGGLTLTSPTVEGAQRVAVFALAVVIGAIAPTAWLSRRRDARVAAVKRDLPEVLDLMTISVEAGVGLEGALDVAVRNLDVPLTAELGHTLREMKLGLSRREALQNLRSRLDVPELSNFVLSLLQADALGMPLGRVLRTQAAELRDRRRQTAREVAAKLPVKMLFPMVGFIMPAIFVVALGPAALDLMRVFG